MVRPDNIGYIIMRLSIARLEIPEGGMDPEFMQDN